MTSKHDLLQTICQHPWISREQLAFYLQLRTRNLQLHLQRLNAAGWIQRVPTPRRAGGAQWLITRAGLAHLATQEGAPLEEFARATDYTPRRLAWLAISRERVALVREFLFALMRHSTWRVRWMAVQAALTFREREAEFIVPCDGLAFLRDANAREIALAIEVDTGSMPILAQRTRWAHLCLAQNDERFCGFEEQKRFPILVILAANAERLREYRQVVLSLVRLAGIVPYTFLITRANLTRWKRDTAAALWETELDATPVPFLHNIEGATESLKQLFTCQTVPRESRVGKLVFDLRPLPPDQLPRKSIRSIATLALALAAFDQVLLEQIGAHPLLSASELAFELQQTPQHVRRRLAALDQWQLIQAHTAPARVQAQFTTRHDTPHTRTRYYTLAERGLWFLATRASFGLAVERFAKFKGWKGRFDDLVKHWEHTRLANIVFIQLLEQARQRGHRLAWLSELEARLYLDDPAAHVSTRYGPRQHTSPRAERARSSEWTDTYCEDDVITPRLNRADRARALAERGQRLRSFLPDGLGIYTTPSHQYTLALEVDRTKVNTDKIMRKLQYYYAVTFEQAHAQWRILIVTSGWERARHWSWYVFRFAQINFAPAHRGMEWKEFIRYLHRTEQQERFIAEWLLPVWITTEAALNTEGVNAPIWLEAKAWAYPEQDVYTRKRLEMRE